MKEEDYLPIIETEADKIHRIIRTGLSFSPVGSGAAVELFNLLVKPPSEKRMERFIVDVISEINKLTTSGMITVESLIGNEEFFSLLLHASQISLRNHQQEKHDALLSALSNSLLNHDYSIDKKMMFIYSLDYMTPIHIKALAAFEARVLWNVPITTKRRITDDVHAKAESIIELLKMKKSDQYVIEGVIDDLASKRYIRDVELLAPTGGEKNVTAGFSTDAIIVGYNIDEKKLARDKVNYATGLSKLGIEFLNFIRTDREH